MWGGKILGFIVDICNLGLVAISWGYLKSNGHTVRPQGKKADADSTFNKKIIVKTEAASPLRSLPVCCYKLLFDSFYNVNATQFTTYKKR